MKEFVSKAEERRYKRYQESRCVLCGDQIEGYGHNPQPVAQKGRCCTFCNDTKVIPTRISNLRRG